MRGRGAGIISNRKRGAAGKHPGEVPKDMARAAMVIDIPVATGQISGQCRVMVHVLRAVRAWQRRQVRSGHNRTGSGGQIFMTGVVEMPLISGSRHTQRLAGKARREHGGQHDHQQVTGEEAEKAAHGRTIAEADGRRKALSRKARPQLPVLPPDEQGRRCIHFLKYSLPQQRASGPHKPDDINIKQGKQYYRYTPLVITNRHIPLVRFNTPANPSEKPGQNPINPCGFKTSSHIMRP